VAGTISTFPPVLAYEIAFNAPPNQATLPPYWTDQSARTKFPGSTQHGRQYELDTNPSGTWRAGLEDKDGALDPSNTGSANYPNVVPYRGCRIRAQTAPTANLLPRIIATGSALLNPATDTVGNYWYQTRTNGSLAQGLYLTAPASGQSTALAWTTPSGTSSANGILYAGVAPIGAPTGPAADCVQVTAGSQYTFSLYGSRASSADATVQVTLSINWYSVTGTLLSTSAGSVLTIPVVTSWARPTVTATAPAGAVWGRPSLAITSPASTTATNILYLTGWQMEQAAAATAWADPGPTYYIYSGMVERWPQAWTMTGTYGLVNIIGVDALAQLAQYTLPAPFVAEILALGPDFFYQLADPASATSCADTTGKRAAAPVENSPFGAGTVTFGSTVTSTNPGSAFVGTPGPVATFSNPASSGVQNACTFVSLHKTANTPGPPQSGGWTRIIAFRVPTTPSNTVMLWAAYPPGWLATNSSSCVINMNAAGAGYISCNVFNALGTGASTQFTNNYADGNWHLVTVSLSADGLTLTTSLDGTVRTAASAGDAHPTGITADVLGAAVQFGPNQYNDGISGDLAFAAQIPAALTSTQIANLYASWRTASQGESSGARIKRILTWVGYTGATAIDTGQTQQMGPATDLTGATALDACDAVALTEAGNVYASTGGALTFKSRASRYNQGTPQFVFGENTAAGEWPYESLTPDYDSTHLFNLAQVTHYASGQVATAADITSQSTYFPRILQRTINPLLYTEAVDASNYLIQQYRSARMRVSDLQLCPSAVPGLFAVCLQLEIGSRIRVMRRPPSLPGAASIQIDCFVESVAWDWDPATGRVEVHLQCSPADLATYWTLGALHTTLHAQAASGQNQASINALPDSAVNALSQSLPQGYQLVFEAGTVRQETMTLAATGIPANNPGYSSATLTFTSNFGFTHAAGTTVCEPLPVGYTDPTTWDASSVLGAVSTTLAAASSSGTNTITVGPLPDVKANAPASDWNTGDLLWIGAGTAAFEGRNLLHPNIATAGEGALPLAAGASGTPLGLAGDVGTPTVAASGTAFQGANVWQVSVAGGVVPTKGLLYILKVPVTAGLAYTASEYTRSATTGANPTVQSYLQFRDATGTSLAQTNSSGVVLTGSPTATWTRMTVTATAPAGTVWAQVGLLLTATAPAGAWTWQADGLQLEQAASASTFQACPQVLSVAAAVPGYSSCVITLAANLANNHVAGESVTDPLPAGDTAASQIAATTRVSY
jgi:hypothetical protein